jgi:hypothetical protein
VVNTHFINEYVREKYIIMVLNRVKRMASLNLLTRIKKNIYNPDYHMVNITIENLNNRQIDIKYKFENQRLSTLTMDF